MLLMHQKCCFPTDVCTLSECKHLLCIRWETSTPPVILHKQISWSLMHMWSFLYRLQLCTYHDLDLVHFCAVMCLIRVKQQAATANIGPQTDKRGKLIVQLGVTDSYDKRISLSLTWAWTTTRVRDGLTAGWLQRTTYRGSSVNAH